MKKRITAIIAIILIFCLLLAYGISFLGMFSVYAAPSKSQIQNELSGVKAEKSEILKKAQTKQVEISELQQQINTIQYDINAYTVKINNLTAELEEAQTKETNQYEAMKLRLRTMYEDNNTTYISLLFSGESLSEVLSYLEIIKQMSEHDNNMHKELEKTRKEIEEKKQLLEDEKKVLDDKKAILQQSQDKIKAEKAELDGMASKLSAEENELFKKLKAIEEEEQALQRQIISGGSHSATSSYGGGKLAYPSGYTTITSPYGYRIHPIYGVRKLHTGIDFGAPMGAAVYAAESGKVIMASYYGGYGNTVIIDHGGGMTTLYAHNSALYVSNGQTVKRGQKIAACGSTGNSTGPHCHFEVRINGATTDPMKYLR